MHVKSVQSVQLPVSRDKVATKAPKKGQIGLKIDSGIFKLEVLVGVNNRRWPFTASFFFSGTAKIGGLRWFWVVIQLMLFFLGGYEALVG